MCPAHALTQLLKNFATEPIIAQDQFDRVQEQMTLKSVIKWGTHHSRGPSAFLVGKVFDETGDRLTPSKTRKNGRSIRYYYSNRLITRGADPTGWRLRADMLEEALQDMVKATSEGNTLQRMQIAPLMTPDDLAEALQVTDTLSIKKALELIAHVELSQTILNIKMNPQALAHRLAIKKDYLDS